MSLSQQHAPRGRSGGGSGGQDQEVAQEAVAEMPAFQQDMGNAFFAEQLLAAAQSAKRDGEVDLGYSLGLTRDEDPGKYNFPGDGETVEPVKAQERRTQDDALPKLREKHASNKYADVKDGKAFMQGQGDEQEVSPNDIRQGALGDCYLMTGMAAVARANPEQIRRLIKDNGDGTFDVTLYIRRNSWSRPEAVTKRVDAQLPTRGPGQLLYANTGDESSEGKELWPALIEKTVAQHKGSYEQIEGANIANSFQFHGATELLTGKPESYQDTGRAAEDDLLLDMAAALEAHKPVSVDSRDMSADATMTTEANAVNVYGNHAYSVESVDLDARTVTLQNPWGSHHVKALSISDFKRFYRGLRIGG